MDRCHQTAHLDRVESDVRLVQIHPLVEPNLRLAQIEQHATVWRSDHLRGGDASSRMASW